MTRFWEVTFANFRSRQSIHSGEHRTHGGINVFVHFDPPLDAAGRFPSGGVAFRIFAFSGPPARFRGFDSRLPLALSTFHHGSYFSQPKYVPVPLVREVLGDGQPYQATIWLAPRVSSKARRQLAQVVASLRFPPARVATIVGQDDLVLHRPGAYPDGSLTSITVPESPPSHATLVHAPGGFYALAWDDPRVDFGYAGQCSGLRITPGKDLVCTNLDARWDRLGRVLAHPTGTRPDPLSFVPVGRSWDRHILLQIAISEPLATARAGGLNVSRLWPGWRSDRHPPPGH